MRQLLAYADVYSDPDQFIDALPDDLTLKEL